MSIPVLLLLLSLSIIRGEETRFVDDICGAINGQRIYLEHGEKGSLQAKFNNILEKYHGGKVLTQKHCSVEFITCPSCVLTFKLTFSNLSKACDHYAEFDSNECDYIWISEPGFKKSAKKFWSRVSSNLEYRTKTKKALVEFFHLKLYDFAFNLTYNSERNRIIYSGSPKHINLNNSTQELTSPFFPNLYPSDLVMEHTINCITNNETCRIRLIFTDFLIAPATIIDFFDWNRKRIFATTGNIFRPPVIVTSGSSLTIRFYANGAADLGFKAHFSFILGSEKRIKTDLNCGGLVNNLGGSITMMTMVLPEGFKSFDCLWLIKPPERYLHTKKYLLLKVVDFSGFAGTTELIIRQGLTSNGSVIENLKFSASSSFKRNEHIVPISEGFYIRLRGFFSAETKLTLVYAAFSYDCLMSSDFLCVNKKCISKLLSCDGFDHCGDESDELGCSEQRRAYKQWSNTPHFLFPKEDDLRDLATPTIIFLLSCFGLVGFIFAMVLLLYRINVKTRHQRHMENHIETINAILEEGAGVIEEEIIISDDPPDYEPPPEYKDVLKKHQQIRCSRCDSNLAGTSTSCQTSLIVPDSPPPPYEELQKDDTQVPFKIIFEKYQFRRFGNTESYVNEGFLANSEWFMRRKGYKPKYFSDSQLFELNHSGESNRIGLNLRKCFTTDDIDLFI